MDEALARKNFGKRLAIARKRAGLTGPDAAALLTDAGYPVGHKAISSWETGNNCPSAIVLGLLAGIYRTTSDELLGIAAVKAPSSTVDLSGQEGMVLAFYRLLSKEDQDAALSDLQRKVAPPQIGLVRKANGK